LFGAGGKIRREITVVWLSSFPGDRDRRPPWRLADTRETWPTSPLPIIALLRKVLLGHSNSKPGWTTDVGQQGQRSLSSHSQLPDMIVRLTDREAVADHSQLPRQLNGERRVFFKRDLRWSAGPQIIGVQQLNSVSIMVVGKSAYITVSVEVMLIEHPRSKSFRGRVLSVAL
jgi:hypothetical protein